MDWIRKFMKYTKEVVKTEEIILEFIYVGKRHTETIKNEKLASEVWEELQIRQFHARVDLIYQSKTQLRRSKTEDKTLKQLRALLEAGGDGRGWTIIGQGSEDMAVIMDEFLAIESLAYIEKNKVEIKKENFISKLHGAKKAVKRIHKYQEFSDVHEHCNHIFVPTGNMVCADCQLPMEKESDHKLRVTNQTRTTSRQ